MAGKMLLPFPDNLWALFCPFISLVSRARVRPGAWNISLMNNTISQLGSWVKNSLSLLKLQKNKKTSIYRTKHVLIEETRRVVCSITLLFKQNSTSALFKRKLLTDEFERMNEILLTYLYTVCCFNHIWFTFFYPSTLQNIFQWGMVMSNQLKLEKSLNSLSRNIEFDSSLYISIYRMNFVFSIVPMTVLHIWQAEKAPQRK